MLLFLNLIIIKNGPGIGQNNNSNPLYLNFYKHQQRENACKPTLTMTMLKV